MNTLKTVAIVLDIIFLLIIAFFSKNLKWHNEKDRASIVGFGMMIFTYILNIVCILRG